MSPYVKRGSLTRNELQDFLDRKAESAKSFSTVDHLRWTCIKTTKWPLMNIIYRRVPLRAYSHRAKPSAPTSPS